MAVQVNVPAASLMNSAYGTHNITIGPTPTLVTNGTHTIRTGMPVPNSTPAPNM